MKITSFHRDITFERDKVITKVILETSFSKEIRIILKKGLVMKEHKAPYPIAVHLLEGDLKFGVENQTYLLKKGDIITLEANVLHSLTALENSVVRLSLSKLDNIKRVQNIVK